MPFCLTEENYVQIECLEVKLLTIKVSKIGQILCAHKPYFLMLSHNNNYIVECGSFVYVATQLKLC